MNCIYDAGHGDKHFGNPGGGGRGTIWKSERAVVLEQMESYLNNKQSDLDLLRMTVGSHYSVDFYIVDNMSVLGLEDETATEFTIQGTYSTSEFNGSTVNYHMYPDATNVSGFGIGISKNEAITYARNH